MSDPKSQPPRRDPVDKNALWSYAYGGTTLAVAVLSGVGAGYYFDQKRGWFPWLTLAGAAAGFALGLYSFLKPFLFRDNSKN